MYISATRSRLTGLCLSAALLCAGQALADQGPADKKAADKKAEQTVEPPTGPFTLEQATAGLKGQGEQLQATIEVVQAGKPLGTFHCALFADKSPLTVANFVGLARGVRPFKDPKSSQWVKRPLYDGMNFHRVIPEFMIQGGDPFCQNDATCGGRGGTGDPGYSFADETQNGVNLDKPGLLAMANKGPDTNGSQFFISEKATPWLNGHHTVFGSCAEADLVKKIGGVEASPQGFPKVAVTIKKITISRKAK